MKDSWKIILGKLAILTMIISGCEADRLPRKRIPVPSSPQELLASGPNRQAATRFGKGSGAAGVVWRLPQKWEVFGPSGMRLATYRFSTGRMTGECYAYFFGSRQGGTVSSNIARWKRQFRGPNGGEPTLKTESRKVNGISMEVVEISGDFTGGMGGKPIPKAKMIGAIVMAPKGMLFFKCLGPEELIISKRPEIMSLFNSIRRE